MRSVFSRNLPALGDISLVYKFHYIRFSGVVPPVRTACAVGPRFVHLFKKSSFGTIGAHVNPFAWNLLTKRSKISFHLREMIGFCSIEDHGFFCDYNYMCMSRSVPLNK